jgi:hypothetical protein
MILLMVYCTILKEQNMITCNNIYLKNLVFLEVIVSNKYHVQVGDDTQMPRVLMSIICMMSNKPYH